MQVDYKMVPMERCDILWCFLKARELAESGNPYKPNHGICFNVYSIARDNYGMDMEYSFFADLFKGWKHHSGNPAYPVPKAYREADAWWKGKGYSYRMNLLDYCIDRLENDYPLPEVLIIEQIEG